MNFELWQHQQKETLESYEEGKRLQQTLPIISDKRNKKKNPSASFKLKKVKTKKETKQERKERYDRIGLLRKPKEQIVPESYIGAKLLKYAVASNLSVPLAIERLSVLGFKDLTPGSILTKEMLRSLHPENQLNERKNLHNGHDFMFSVHTSDIFLNRELRQVTLKDTTYQTFFSDVEAFAICGGLSSAHARKLHKYFFSRTSLEHKDYFDAHMFAMTAIEKYGSEMLSYCLSLPPLPFGEIKVFKAFKLLSRLKSERPSISFYLPNRYDEKNPQRHVMVFGLNEITKEENREVIHVKNFKTNDVVATLKTDGTITPSINHSFYRCQLQLFMTILNNPREAIITYGAKTGTCAVCGKELTTQESALRGMGPVCARMSGLYN